jgi:hypothetical protein
MPDPYIELFRIFWLCYGIIGFVVMLCCALVYATSLSAMRMRPPEVPPWMPPSGMFGD